MLPLVLLFLFLSTGLKAETSLYDELKFLEESSNEVEVFIPGEKESTKKKTTAELYSDSISTGQAAILKKPIKSDTYNAPLQAKKRLRFRSR